VYSLLELEGTGRRPGAQGRSCLWCLSSTAKLESHGIEQMSRGAGGDMRRTHRGRAVNGRGLWW
jgi:hypothetical protein